MLPQGLRHIVPSLVRPLATVLLVRVAETLTTKPAKKRQTVVGATAHLVDETETVKRADPGAVENQVGAISAEARLIYKRGPDRGRQANRKRLRPLR